jgi:hypothetical protein
LPTGRGRQRRRLDIDDRRFVGASSRLSIGSLQWRPDE